MFKVRNNSIQPFKFNPKVRTIYHIFASRIANIPSNVSYIKLSETEIRESAQMIDILDNNNEMMSISVDELMHGSNRLSPYNYVSTNDPFYEPYTFYTTLCNDENTYYVYDHSSGILTASSGNTRITYTPTVMPDGLKFTLNGVYDYYPYGKILREYVQGPQEKYLTTHHQRDEETGLDYRGARFYDCDVARFLSLDPHAQKYANINAYNYSLCNPVIYVDPSGLEPYLFFNAAAKSIMIFDDNGTPNDYSDDQFLASGNAHNNVASNSNGKWEDGNYEMIDKKTPNTHNGYDRNGD